MRHIGNPEYQYSLRLDGAEVVAGDSNTIGVIYNNLIGVNSPSGGLEIYRRFMGQSILSNPEGFGAGRHLAMVTPDGAIISEGIIGEPAARVTQAMVDAAGVTRH